MSRALAKSHAGRLGPRRMASSRGRLETHAPKTQEAVRIKAVAAPSRLPAWRFRHLRRPSRPETPVLKLKRRYETSGERDGDELSGFAALRRPEVPRQCATKGPTSGPAFAPWRFVRKYRARCCRHIGRIEESAEGIGVFGEVSCWARLERVDERRGRKRRCRVRLAYDRLFNKPEIPRAR
jgi:hypothetical protein